MRTFRKMLREEAGATAAEYALIMAIVGSTLAMAALFLGNTISNAMNSEAQHITDCTDGIC